MFSNHSSFIFWAQHINTPGAKTRIHRPLAEYPSCRVSVCSNFAGTVPFWTCPGHPVGAFKWMLLSHFQCDTWDRYLKWQKKWEPFPSAPTPRSWSAETRAPVLIVQCSIPLSHCSAPALQHIKLDLELGSSWACQRVVAGRGKVGVGGKVEHPICKQRNVLALPKLTTRLESCPRVGYNCPTRDS